MTAALERHDWSFAPCPAHAEPGRRRDHRDPRPGRRNRRHHVLRRVPRSGHLPDRRAVGDRRPADHRGRRRGAAVLGDRGRGQRARLRIGPGRGLAGPGPWPRRADDHQRRHRLHGAARQELRGPRRRGRRRGADLPGRHHGVPGLRGRRARRAGGRRRHARGRAGRPARGRPAAEDPLHHPGLPESDRADAVRGAPGRAGRAGPPVRVPDPRGRRLPRAGFRQAPPPSLWSMAPDVVLQAGTFSKIFWPGVRMGWAAGRPRSSAAWSWPSRTPTSARARSASGCWRSTAAAATWTGRLFARARCTRGGPS